MSRPLFPVLALWLVSLACGSPPVAVEPPVECRTVADCAIGERCEAGSCRREEPRGCHPPCGAAQPICDEARGYCKVCTATAGCEGGTPFCDVAANGGEGACVGCLDDGDCTPPSVCDPVTRACSGCTATSGCSGDTPICADGTCVACTETEGCGGDTPVCDPRVPGGACVVCTATAGCAEGKVCDVSVPGGACVTCTAEEGCGGETPACDPTVPGGACVECVAAGDCAEGRLCDAARRCVTCTADHEGCAAPVPYCDAAADDGRGACVGCLSDLACGGDTPVCHPERRACVGCASDLDCGGATPRCDPEAFEGAGACVGCVDSGDCGGATPVCDRGADGGFAACVACTETEGCGAGRFCDPGAGACVVCTEARGCGGSTPVCDTEVAGGACVTCTDDTDCVGDPARPLCDRARTAVGACVRCTADHRGCGGDTPFCRAGADWGAGVCQRCTETEGCGGDTPVCDLSVGGGACVVCTEHAGCGGTTPVCDTSVPGGTCKTCLADGRGCFWHRPACDVEASGGLGACVTCYSNADCAPPTPACDRAADACVGCVTSADCTGYLGACNTAVQRCVECTPTEGCGGDQPFCVVDFYGPNQPRCVRCRGPNDCAPDVETCDADGECLNFATQSLVGVRASTRTSITRATVTYVRPAVGAEPAGFFLQGELPGPALFVAVDPATLVPAPAVGDRVSFQVLAKATVNGIQQITALDGLNIFSSGSPVIPLVQDVSGDPRILYRPTLYESEVVSIAGRLGPFAATGPGFVAAPIETAYWGQPLPELQLRLPDTLRLAMDLTAGCEVTVAAVPFWFAGATVLPTAYAASDFTAVSCPAPTLLSAVAGSPTIVLLSFDRQLDPATLLPDGSQFTVSPPLAVLGAGPATVVGFPGSHVGLLTEPQVAGQAYTITVAGTVHGLHGTGVAQPASATFFGAP